MYRKLFSIALLATFALPVSADPPAAPPETLIRLTVQPMAAPKPALRYHLLPELKEMNPGNPIQNYLKCFAEQQTFFFDKAACDHRDKMLAMPLKELAARGPEDMGKSALRQADWAARLDKPDWQILIQCKTEGIGLLLPDVQQMRVLANALKVRFRTEIALHQYDDAIRTAQTMFALSRHMGEHPTIISGLVGIAITQITIGPLEEMLEQPGCPNLYWALTSLPTPFISLEPGMQGERMLIAGEFRELDNAVPMTDEQIKKAIAHIDRIREVEKSESGSGTKEAGTRELLDAKIKQEGFVSAARKRLVETGLPDERLARFPADQIVLLDAYREYEVLRDEGMKLISLPTWQAEAMGLGVPYERKKHARLLADLLVPALFKVHRAQGRLEQRIALLRHVEALRLYAADHDGKLPQTLDEFTVPLPVDPFTGKPFRYNVEGTTAHVRGSPPPGAEDRPEFNVHYIVTIQK